MDRIGRLIETGELISYEARNAGGYTLEAQLGIIPNGRSEPDYFGWELKAFNKNRITLMTPEPNGGFYHERSAKEFVLRYGHAVTTTTVSYFTGVHKVGLRCDKTGMILETRGFDLEKGKITDTSGGIFLIAADGTEAAAWTFPVLLKHWSRKHTQACYIRYDKQMQNGKTGYIYKNPILLGEGTDFTHFLIAMASGRVVLDPASKVSRLDNGASRLKARNQFRTNFKDLPYLYTHFEEVQCKD